MELILFLRSILHGRANKKRSKGSPEFQLEDLDEVMKEYNYAEARKIFRDALDNNLETEHVFQVAKLFPKYELPCTFNKESSLERYGFAPTIVESKRKAEEDISKSPKKQKLEEEELVVRGSEEHQRCQMLGVRFCKERPCKDKNCGYDTHIYLVEKGFEDKRQYCSKCNRMKITSNQDGTGESFCIRCDTGVVQLRDPRDLAMTEADVCQFLSSTPAELGYQVCTQPCSWSVCDICCRDQVCEACRTNTDPGGWTIFHCRDCKYDYKTKVCNHRCKKCTIDIKGSKVLLYEQQHPDNPITFTE